VASVKIILRNSSICHLERSEGPFFLQPDINFHGFKMLSGINDSRFLHFLFPADGAKKNADLYVQPDFTF
jgi:hypothetical protein